MRGLAKNQVQESGGAKADVTLKQLLRAVSRRLCLLNAVELNERAGLRSPAARPPHV